MVEQLNEREVNDLATLKALADPVRLSIINTLMERSPEALTVKEIAAALGEPPTKLYRHIKQLEQTSLILVAGTRVVSGITESRYLPAQKSLRLTGEVFADRSIERTEAIGPLLAAVDLVRNEFRNHYLADRLDLPSVAPGKPASPAAFSHFNIRLRPERVVRLRNQLGAIMDELATEGDSRDPDAVQVSLLSLLYAVKPEPSAPAGD
ncbi:helix-turn-helix domain-containing protein [Kitasatospora sp. NPDC002040]|uniref:helix-turn-helix domain-containing protein n=1 Tax=Kitasatospora sp. NPDC002040 TaxID=3154661 RepID=UPI003332F8D8